MRSVLAGEPPDPADLRNCFRSTGLRSDPGTERKICARLRGTRAAEDPMRTDPECYNNAGAATGRLTDQSPENRSEIQGARIMNTTKPEGTAASPDISGVEARKDLGVIGVICRHILCFTALILAMMFLRSAVTQPPHPLPEHSANFSAQDFSHVLSRETEDLIARQTAEIQQLTGIRMALVTVPGTGSESPEAYARQTAASLGLGPDRNSSSRKGEGILILLDTSGKAAAVSSGGILPPEEEKALRSAFRAPGSAGIWDRTAADLFARTAASLCRKQGADLPAAFRSLPREGTSERAGTGSEPAHDPRIPGKASDQQIPGTDLSGDPVLPPPQSLDHGETLPRRIGTGALAAVILLLFTLPFRFVFRLLSRKGKAGSITQATGESRTDRHRTAGSLLAVIVAGTSLCGLIRNGPVCHDYTAGTAGESFYVQDFSGVFTDETERFITGAARSLRDATTAQVVVMAVPDTGSQSLEEFSLDTASRLGIGSAARDNGILLLFTTEQPHVRLEVGRGLEGLITDSRAGRILDKHAVEPKNSRRWNEAALKTFSAVAEIIYRDQSLEPPPDLNHRGTIEEDPRGPTFADRIPGEKSLAAGESFLEQLKKAFLLFLGWLMAVGLPLLIWHWLRKKGHHPASGGDEDPGDSGSYSSGSYDSGSNSSDSNSYSDSGGGGNFGGGGASR